MIKQLAPTKNCRKTVKPKIGNKRKKKSTLATENTFCSVFFIIFSHFHNPPHRDITQPHHHGTPPTHKGGSVPKVHVLRLTHD